MAKLPWLCGLTKRLFGCSSCMLAAEGRHIQPDAGPRRIDHSDQQWLCRGSFPTCPRMLKIERRTSSTQNSCPSIVLQPFLPSQPIFFPPAAPTQL